jgi:hypothetical protein
MEARPMSKKKEKAPEVAVEAEVPADPTVNRFDLEQKFLNTWHITDDVRLLASRHASLADWEALAKLYDIRFDDTFTYFEQMIRERKIQ